MYKPLMYKEILIVFTILLPASGWAWSGKVITVHDGDTITVQREGTSKPVKVRVYGIDCPELGQDFGAEAKNLTESLLLGKVVEVVPVGGTSYRREVAGLVLVQDMLILQDVLASSGLAWVDDRYCRAAACTYWRLHQKDARTAEPPRGLWAADKPLSPREWRLQRKKAAR